MYLQSYNASRPWPRLCNLTKMPRFMFPSCKGGEPAAINLQRLSAVDEYKDIIINDVKYSTFADTDDSLQPFTKITLKKRKVAVITQTDLQREIVKAKG